MFKRHRYPKSIILQAVYFKLRFTLSYRDVEEILRIRGVIVDYYTIYRWVIKFSPMIEATMHKRKKHVCDRLTGFFYWTVAKVLAQNHITD
jgi:putative transposase